MNKAALLTVLALAAASPAAALENPQNGLLRMDIPKPAMSRAYAARFSRELRKLPNGRRLPAGRMSLKGPAFSALLLRADAVFVPKGGDPENYRLATELRAETALSRSVSLKIGWSEEHDSSFKPAPRLSETRWSAAMCLRF